MPDSLPLVPRVGDDDGSALRELLVRHLPDLRAYIRMRSNAAMRVREAESDIVQSVCREVLLSAPNVSFDSEAAFRSWLFTIVLSKVHHRLRHQFARRRDQRRKVAFDAEQRQAVAMARIARMKSKDIAPLIGKTPAAVRQILHRSLRRLGDALERRGFSVGGDSGC